MNFVKVGATYINLDNVAYVEEVSSSELLIRFVVNHQTGSSGQLYKLTIVGKDAEDFKKYMNGFLLPHPDFKS